MDLLLTPAEHVLRCDIADGTVQADVVLMLRRGLGIPRGVDFHLAEIGVGPLAVASRLGSIPKRSVSLVRIHRRVLHVLEYGRKFCLSCISRDRVD